MRPGFLSGTDYWFRGAKQLGDLTRSTKNTTGWRRSSSRPSEEVYYRAQTEIPWYNEFWVEKPLWEEYLD
tara:strand:+ start:369 stop:578 length:210 start_codon:yes stop_codon:yes gene_type:complete